MTGIVLIGIGTAVALFLLGVVLDLGARRRRGDVARAPATLPALYPRINTDACICSGACVSVCPEGDVIAIVDGRPQIVRPTACVGHGDCLRSCPVSAIELVLGSAARAVEVPVTTGTFETTVPGLFVAGEITGMALIHNAVAQGRQAAAAALALRDDDGHDHDYDVIVVGAGPAGIGAALEAQHRGTRYVVFERGALGGAIRSYPRAKIVMSAPLDLPGIGKMKLRRTSKEALVELFEDVVKRADLAIAEHVDVTAISAIRGGLRVDTTQGSATARRVILAIGRRGTPRRLGVAGDDLPHVVYHVEEPAQHAGKQVVVVGGGDSAAELALALAAQPGTDVALVHRGADFGRCKPDNQTALHAAWSSGRLAIHVDTTVRAVTATRIELATGDSSWLAAATLVVCCLGTDLPSQWLRGLGIALRELRGEPLARAS